MMQQHEPAGELPPGWQAIMDDTHQRFYYYDTKTGNSQWEIPIVPRAIPPPPPIAIPPPPPVSSVATSATGAYKTTTPTQATTTPQSTSNFDYNNPQRDQESEEEEEPYILEEGVLDDGYDSDGNPIDYDNMEVNYGDVYNDDDDGWIAAVNPVVKGNKEMGSNPALKSNTGGAAVPNTSSANSNSNQRPQPTASQSAPKANLPKPVFPNAQSPTSAGFPNVSIGYDKGSNHEHMQCVIIRDRHGITAKMYPTYELHLESTGSPLLMAKKMNLNRTSNYHLFDLTRGSASNKSMFTKNSGNFIGKLRARDMQRTEYVLLNASGAEREEIAGFMFDRLDVMTSLTEGSQPRKLLVVIPPLDSTGVPIPNRVAIGSEDTGSIINVLRYPARTSGLHVLQTKEPTFINGNYRLNFRGRVKIPSVKNFQIVSADNVDNVLVQFGKIGDDRFHLDFKAPFNAVQAFALALSQFNL